MAEPITRVTLLVPGMPSSEREWGKALQHGGLRIEKGTLRGDQLEARVLVDWVANDGEFANAFSFGTIGADVLAALAATPGALVLDCSVDLRSGRTQLVSVVERLRDAGAIAVRIEQSKLGWEVSQWIELFSSDDPWSWHRGAVVFLDGEDATQSCGMHAFSLPDVRVPTGGDTQAERELASLLSVYQLAEDPVIRSGQTFSPEPGAPRRVVEQWPDTEYPPEHSCHNPYGVWRLGQPGGAARPMGKLVPVFIPALHVLLLALEKKNGRALTLKQVVAMRDKAACIAMEPRDALKLDHERGYSDLDPELVWEQWQLVRADATP